ncbi:MAG: SH3 domain-containing protein [Pseudomonadota bacterium]
MKRILLAFLALFTVDPALAGEGSSTTFLNVRTGPGTGNPVVAGLAPGEVVDILQCSGDGWCQIAGGGKEGWVSARFLTAPPSAGQADPRCRWDLDLTGIDPVFRAVCPAGVVPPEPPPPPGDLACFYADKNYGGARTCLDPGDYATLDAGVDNTFNSVQVQGEARVRLCTEPDLGGICMDWLENATVLDRRLQSQASSVKVYVGFLPPPPPPPPIVHVEGTVTIPINGRANLDTGRPGPAGADIWWRRDADGIRLLPVNGAQLGLGNGSDRSLFECREEAFTEAAVGSAALLPGTVVCVKTNLGRTGRVEIGASEASGVEVMFITWGE